MTEEEKLLAKLEPALKQQTLIDIKELLEHLLETVKSIREKLSEH